MGAGWFEKEHLAFGFPFPSRRERMDILMEQVEIVHRLWAATHTDLESVELIGREVLPAAGSL